MSKWIHIFNERKIAQQFEEVPLIGEQVVFNEMLNEGPVHKDVGSDAFFKLRYAYFEKTYQINKLAYFDNSIKPLVTLENADAYSNVVLWFDYSLVNQINMIAICVYLLKNYRKDHLYFIVHIGEKEKTQLILSNNFSSTYEKLFQHKIKLTRNNLVYAKECWDIFVSKDKEELKNFNFNKSDKFKYLQKAIQNYLNKL
jgi:hypothetical protein